MVILVLVIAIAAATPFSILLTRGGPSSTSGNGSARRLRPTGIETQERQAPRTAVAPGATGFIYPVEDGCLPKDDYLMPGAPREYRRGLHEGVDFYDSDNCSSIGLDTEVVATRVGVVIRADRSYQDLTAETLAALTRRVEQGESNAPDVVDAFRGRQVWIDHGEGEVTRYAHLNGIARGIEPGVRVEEGQVIGYVGESGTPGSVNEPGSEVHLHFEIRIGDGFLGEGVNNPEQMRQLYEQAFSQ